MYVRIDPTDDGIDPATVTDHVRRLYKLDPPTTSWWRQLFASAPAPLEWALVARGSTNRSVEYYAGCPGNDSATDQFKRILRGLFPDSYELETVDQSPLFGIGDEDASSSNDPTAAVEFVGRAELRRDWQTTLTPFKHFQRAEHARVPLAAVVEVMADYDLPMLYQALLQPYPNWTTDRNARIQAIEAHQDTVGQQLWSVIAGSPDADAPLPPGDEARIAELRRRDPRRSFVVNARVAVMGRSSDSESLSTHAAEDVATTLDAVGNTTHQLDARVCTGDDAQAVRTAISERTVHPPNYERLTTQVPFVANTSRGIVADASETPNFCLLDGSALTTAGERALATIPDERLALPRPPTDQLSTYQGEGLTLGSPLTQDSTVAETPIAVPPDLQPLHLMWLGKTGSGKSTALVNAMLANHATTDGLDILIDRKGDGMARTYLRAHYLEYGSLENVSYFDCTETLPALSFFDIRDQLEAGIDRTTAVEDVVEHYVEILKGVMGADRYERAVRSPDVIRYLVKALFDPIHGDDAFSHRDLQTAIARMADTRDAPAVTDPDLERMLGGVTANSKRSFDELMQGVTNRIEKIPMHERLGTIFNHVPPADEHAFDVRALLDEDAVIIVDVGGLRVEAQRVLTLVLLSDLWTALRHRTGAGSERAADGDGDHPLVNLYLEEAADVADSDLVGDLLAQSRSFGLSVTLAMQFPGQLRERNRDAYNELLNNVSTVITGNVGVDRDLAQRLATADMDPQDVGNRLRSLSRGEWLTSLPAPFNEEEPRPFLVESMPLPPGHPDGDRPLDDEQRELVDAAITRATARTRLQYGLDATAPTRSHETSAPASADTQGADPPASEADDPDVSRSTVGSDRPRIDTTLPFTRRLPRCVEYDPDGNAVLCSRCDTPNPPSLSGMKRAIQCCHSLDEVDTANIPALRVDLMLSPSERAELDYSTRQLVFVQLVLNAQRLEYDPDLEYDLLFDSMIRLQEYAGLDDGALQELLDDGLLRHDCDHPHRLYSVTAEGRNCIDETAREGVDYGHGKGDLDESSQHVLGVEVGRQALERQFVDDPDSPATTVIPYYEVDDGHRLDIAALDADGDVVVTVEVERINHDVREAVPSDYDKMAACNPEEAFWIVMTQSAGHRVLEALNDPPDGTPRVEKTYSPTTPPQQFRLDAPGCTGIRPVIYLRDRLDDLTVLST